MRRRSLVLISLLALGFPHVSSSQTLDYFVRESIPLPTDTVRALLAVRDMDADGNLDIVLNTNDRTLTILEREGSSFVVRFSHSEPPATVTSLRGPAVAEVDGDLTPEMIAGARLNHRIRIWEADADNSYAVRLSMTFGDYIEGIRAGDSDGDGLREFLVPEETFPSRVTLLESTADNTFSTVGVLTGDGGNVAVAGTLDLDGDGNPETVFSDDGYSTTAGRIYVFENGTLVFTDPTLGALSDSLGDTDGNGLGEIICRRRDQAGLKVLESTGIADGFQIVFDQDSDYERFVLDADGNGRSEFWRSVLDETGERRTFTLASRAGSELFDIYNSGPLLRGFPGDIRQILAIGDTNGDSGLELAVVQGGLLHILEFVVPKAGPPIPTLSYWGAMLLILSLLIVSIRLLSVRRSPGFRSLPGTGEPPRH
jgi:hypothetical protein